MSGHNKWSQIKHRKAATDAVKSKVYTKFSRLITMEAKRAGGNVDSPGLKAALERARKANVPNDTIERAVKKATDTNAAAMETVLYEAYGPGGVALIIEGVTDNKNRTAAEIRHTLSENSANLATSGAATWAFTKSEEGGWKAHTTVPLSPDDTASLEKLVSILTDNDDVQNVYTNAA